MHMWRFEVDIWCLSLSLELMEAVVTEASTYKQPTKSFRSLTCGHTLKRATPDLSQFFTKSKLIYIVLELSNIHCPKGSMCLIHASSLYKSNQ